MNTVVASWGATVDAPLGPVPCAAWSGALSTTLVRPPRALLGQAAAIAAAEAATAANVASQVDAPLVTPAALGHWPPPAAVSPRK